MSDNSTSSSGSSSNSWTILSPEEAAAEAVGQVDDGTESLGDAPSLSEDMTASSVEAKLGEEDPPVEAMLSEEGHQVCQETSPEICEEGAALVSPSSSSHTPELDPEIHAPVIHDTITTSPPDSDLLGAAPFAITESSLLLAEEPIDLQTPLEEPIDVSSSPEIPVQESPTPEMTSETSPTPEITSETSPTPEITAETSSAPEITAEKSSTPEITAETSSTLEPPSERSPSPRSAVSDVEADHTPVPEPKSPTPENPPVVSPPTDSYMEASPTLAEGLFPETIGSATTEEEPPIEKEETELPEKLKEVVKEPESIGADLAPVLDDGLRLRHVTPTVTLRRSSDEDEEEEEEFKLPERKEEKRSFSLNQLIVGALVLLCLGSFFFSDDFDGSELTDQELLDKFAQENKQISTLEAQLQVQKEQLDKALRTAADNANAGKENAKMKEELSSLPGLKTELEALRARVAELSELTVEEEVPESPPSEVPTSESQSAPANQAADKRPDKKEELKRQKTLLEESKRRLESMKKQGGVKKGVRESLVAMQKRLLDQVDYLGKRHEWKKKHHESKAVKKQWGGKKEWNGKKDQHSHWKREETEKKKEWKHGKDVKQKYGGWRKGGEGSHKEHWKRYHEEWDHRKAERKMEREQRKKDRPWHTKSFKASGHHQRHHHQHHQHHEQPHHQQQDKRQHEQVDFWKHQEEKLRRNQHSPEGCSGVADCAAAEGLVPVQLAEFQALLDSYLSKLEGAAVESKEALGRLVAQFFRGGVFAHDSMLFGEFAEDVADVLEDLADVLEDQQPGDDTDTLEEEMEEFEREALWKFAAAA